MNTNDLIYLIGELYVQRREQQMENEKLRDEIKEKGSTTSTAHPQTKVSDKDIE